MCKLMQKNVSALHCERQGCADGGKPRKPGLLGRKIGKPRNGVVFQIDTGLKAAHQGIGGQIRSNLYNSSRSGAVAAFRGLWRLHTIARAGDDLQAFMPCSQVFEKGRFK
ncbi:hypothetical protein ALQ36_103654 [Pseudomonas syringae pv. primulae]|uniref:Uncharacterized protein n=1 Tax=Pseudomonas syringae pv. primulae TaxID=251707 RepID=A0A3M5TTB9_9PSED|nr:hypothetical protein ALQ36_103654 [Pseudomonas syringae pv. primulae]RMU36198.1 hypothetical protein ALP30_104207 [Pseudomonas syringae pv. primulae]